jgi:hypothetical protein
VATHLHRIGVKSDCNGNIQCLQCLISTVFPSFAALRFFARVFRKVFLTVRFYLNILNFVGTHQRTTYLYSIFVSGLFVIYLWQLILQKMSFESEFNRGWGRGRDTQPSTYQDAPNGKYLPNLFGQIRLSKK